ncbi:hypothetical protein COU37_01005 [Candidatus Micrarchaeota archaeon CG10_big_fil_rev_8_21_14_0_10_45_29]|nr:MAG: hypothetical protein COU37_01005 [Candidatus Micrarchaeota archaeon CG10_big_fil_rev_8_21_14_0_10_45_29]
MILTLVRPRLILRVRGDDEIERFCRSMQLVSQRDLDNTVTSVLRAMLDEGARGPVGSSELASRAHINRVTVIHHLRRLERAGIVEKEERKYRLVQSGLCDVVRKMRLEMEQTLNEAQLLAQKLDNSYLATAQPQARKGRIVPIEEEEQVKKAAKKKKKK